MIMKLLQIDNKKNNKLLYLDTQPSDKKKEERGKDIMKIVCFLGTISTSKV